MDQEKMPEGLQERQVKLTSDPQPDLEQSSTASDGNQQASTSNIFYKFWNYLRSLFINMDQARMSEELQEPPTEQSILAKDPHPDLGQSSTASDGYQQASTFNSEPQASTSNTKPQATNEVPDRSAGKSASTSGSGILIYVNDCILTLVSERRRIQCGMCAQILKWPLDRH